MHRCTNAPMPNYYRLPPSHLATLCMITMLNYVKLVETRLNAFTRSCIFNASALQSKFKIASSRSRFFAIFQFLAPPPKYSGPSPHLGTALETPFSSLSFGKSFMKIRSAVPENGCLIFMHYRCGGRKKNKRRKAKKNICKT